VDPADAGVAPLIFSLGWDLARGERAIVLARERSRGVL
jgi:hypothetical protein